MVSRSQQLPASVEQRASRRIRGLRSGSSSRAPRCLQGGEKGGEVQLPASVEQRASQRMRGLRSGSSSRADRCLHGGGEKGRRRRGER